PQSLWTPTGLVESGTPCRAHQFAARGQRWATRFLDLFWRLATARARRCPCGCAFARSGTHGAHFAPLCALAVGGGLACADIRRRALARQAFAVEGRGAGRSSRVGCRRTALPRGAARTARGCDVDATRHPPSHDCEPGAVLAVGDLSN